MPWSGWCTHGRSLVILCDFVYQGHPQEEVGGTGGDPLATWEYCIWTSWRELLRRENVHRSKVAVGAPAKVSDLSLLRPL